MDSFRKLIFLFLIFSFQTASAVSVQGYSILGVTAPTLQDLCTNPSVTSQMGNLFRAAWGNYPDSSLNFWVNGGSCAASLNSPPYMQKNVGWAYATVNCTAGTSKNLYDYATSGTPLTIYIGSGPNLSDGFCEYTCNQPGLTYFTTSGRYQQYSCSATGAAKSASTSGLNTVPADAKPVTPTQPTNSTGSSCTVSTTGASICTGGTIPTGCYTVDGYKVCQGSNNSSVNNNYIAPTDSKNCVSAGSKSICAVSATDPKAEYCGTVNGVKQCFSSSAVTQQSTTTTTANADGSTTKTTTTTNNVVDGGQQVKTITTAANGTVTETITGSLSTGQDAIQNGKLDKIAENSAKSECEKNPNSVGCMQAGDTSGTETVPTQNVSTALTPSSWGSASSCPAPKTITIHGVQQVFSWQPECDFAVGIKPIVLSLAWVAAAFAVVGAVRES